MPPYKTIILELLQERPTLHDQLRASKSLLPALHRLGTELKASHLAWIDRLAQAKPESDHSQLSSQALELALKDLTDHLPSELPPSGQEPLSLDAAMASLHRHTPNA